MTNTTRYSTPFYKPFTAGSSRIRRTASNYTDYVASQAADYILQRDGQINKNDVCGCVRVTYTFSGSIFNIAISSTVTSQTIAVIAAYIENLLGLPAGSVTNLSIG
jgi:hypothetical protein